MTKGLDILVAGVVNGAGQRLTAVTVTTTFIDTAEEIAIALAATTNNKTVTILTDPQSAYRNYKRGTFSAPALRILVHSKTLTEIIVISIPGHAAIEGNEAAHAAARELIHRAIVQEDDSSKRLQPLRTYTGILARYRHERCKHPHHTGASEQKNVQL